MRSALRYMMSVSLFIGATAGIRADEPFNPSDPPEPMVQYAVSIAADPAEGTSSISLGGSFSLGKEIAISVTPASDYTFQYWTLNGVLYSNNRSFTYVVGDSTASFVAVLKLKSLVTVSVTPENAGSAYGGGRYVEGARQRIYTYGNSGFTFLHWTLNGEIYSESTSFYYYVGDSTANFVAVYQDDTVEPEPDPDEPFVPEDPAEPEVYYRLEVNTNLPQGISPITINASAYYSPGKNVTLFTAAPDGYVFLHWTLNDVLYSDQTSCPYVMGDSDVVFTAHFDKMHTISLKANPPEAGTVSGVGTYAPGSKVLISTTPNEGYTFLYWARYGEVYAETLSFYYIVNTVDAAFEAVYQKIEVQPDPEPEPEPEPETDEPFIPSNPPEPETDKVALLITVGVNDAALGTVTGLPETPLFAGDLITLTATPTNEEQYYFLHWTDGNTANPRDITLTVDARYVAVFAKQKYTVTFFDEDSVTILDKRAWDYGDLPTCVSPAKPSDEENSYRFLGWQPQIVTVTQDTAYYATYEALPLEVPLGIDPVTGNPSPVTRKMIINHQLFILRDEKIYTVMGQEKK